MFKVDDIIRHRRSRPRYESCSSCESEKPPNRYLMCNDCRKSLCAMCGKMVFRRHYSNSTCMRLLCDDYSVVECAGLLAF